MKLFVLKHDGFWLGGFIIVFAENKERASDIIESEMKKAGVHEKDYDLNNIAEVEQKEQLVFFSTGDY